ncbi:hypothetical protein PACTADRAFT_23392, partial [Pachysolen tannophilus NRRL Y-2460]
PMPAPPLNLSNLNNYKDDLTKKFSNLNILKNLQQMKQREIEGKEAPIVDQEEDKSKLAFKYAKLSLDLINEVDTDSKISMVSNPLDGETTNTNTILTLRLARVLNSSNFNSSVRDALVFLQSRIDDSQINNGNNGSSTSILNINYNSLTDSGLLGSISRRKLRSEIESDILKQQFQTLKSIYPIVKKLNNVKEKLDDLNHFNNEIFNDLNYEINSTKKLKENINLLKNEKSLLTLKKNLLKNFKKNYTLSQYEEFRLINEDIDDEFLNILKKVQTIRNNCSILLSLNNPKIGLTILNKTNNLINLSTEKILNFVTRQLHPKNSIFTEDNIHRDSKIFKKSLIYILNEKPEFFQQIIDDLIQSRSKVLVDEFLLQINGYSEQRSGNNRPFLLSAYDSKRFLGDLLAYLHDVIVNERELISSLFDVDEGIISSYNPSFSLDLNINNHVENDEDLKDINKIVDKIIEEDVSALSVPLRSNIEQIIRSEGKLTVLQSIYQLLELYNMMYAKVLPSSSKKINTTIVVDNSILTTIGSLQKLSIERIFSIVKLKLNSIQHKKDDGSVVIDEEIDDDFNIPEWLVEFYSIVIPLFDNLNYTQETFMSVTKEEHDSFLKIIFDNVLNVLNLQIAQSNLNENDSIIFKLNCFDFISSKIITIRLLNEKSAQLNSLIHDLTTSLESQQFNLLLTESNLNDIYYLINMISSVEDEFFDVTIYEPIVENKLFNMELFQIINLNLAEVLPIALIDFQQHKLSKLLSPSIANDIILNSSIRFVNFYYKLWLITAKYLKTSNVVENRSGHPCFKWNDVEVAMLLGCEEDYLKQKENYEED